LQWKYDTGGFINGCPAVNAEGTVFFGSADGKIYAVNRAEGYEWILDGVYDSHWPFILAPTLAKDG
jgi:outer membrane protein assembly factor BamB